MSQRRICSVCNKAPGSGEPPLCDNCFLEEYRHDPACINSVYASAYCGGPEKCAKCKSKETRDEG